MKTAIITGKHVPDINRGKSIIPLVLAFTAGLVMTVCLSLLPVVNETLLPQPAEINPAPKTPAIPDSMTAGA